MLSIIVPVYKVEYQKLEKCINSLLNQTSNKSEIILVDDGSPDDCGIICDKYSKKSDKIKVVHTSNLGVSNARNIGIKKAKGNIITFVDSDDWVENNFVETILENFDKDIDILLFDAIVHSNNHAEENNFFIDDEKYFLNKDIELLQLQTIYRKSTLPAPKFVGCGVTWCKAYKKQFIYENKLAFDLNFIRGQDLIFNLQCFEKVSKLKYIKKYLYHYIVYETSSMRKYNPYSQKYLERIIDYMNDFIKNKQSIEYEKAYIMRTINLLFVIIANNYCHKENKSSIKERKNGIKVLLNKEIFKDVLESQIIEELDIKTKIKMVLLKNNCIYSYMFLTKIKNA